MHNQDNLHTWWWGPGGPANAGPLTIGQIKAALQPAWATGVVSGRQGNKISAAGWNYAVLKFLIEKCSLPQVVKAALIANANPQNGNYGGWRKHRKVQAKINPVPAPGINGIMAANSLTAPNMTKNNTLVELISGLQKTIASGGINKGTVENAGKALSDLGYQYDDRRFPALVGTENFADTSGETPSNLAEALLWKLGKWQSYKKFAANYTADDTKPTKQNVVFFAFARHLKDKKNPIYDQHAIRALWAICGKLTANERKKCKSLLFDGKGKWKQTGSGGATIECYELFVRHLNDLVPPDNGATRSEIDRLLMPLGQAIKKSTGSYVEFHQLCDWPIDG
jgi:hypothetical protein